MMIAALPRWAAENPAALLALVLNGGFALLLPFLRGDPRSGRGDLAPTEILPIYILNSQVSGCRPPATHAAAQHLRVILDHITPPALPYHRDMDYTRFNEESHVSQSPERWQSHTSVRRVTRSACHQKAPTATGPM